MGERRFTITLFLSVLVFISSCNPFSSLTEAEQIEEVKRAGDSVFRGIHSSYVDLANIDGYMISDTITKASFENNEGTVKADGTYYLYSNRSSMIFYFTFSSYQDPITDFILNGTVFMTGTVYDDNSLTGTYEWNITVCRSSIRNLEADIEVEGNTSTGEEYFTAGWIRADGVEFDAVLFEES